MPDSFADLTSSSDVLASISLLAMLVLLQLVLSRALRRRGDLSAQIVRRWSANVRNFLLLVALIGLIMIWAPQLRTFAISLTAFAVAVVVAMKELILCLSGSALRTFTRAYAVGDYIELGGTRGEVLDHNLLVTRLAEFERREGSMLATGREVILPHSLLFGLPLRVETPVEGRVRHTVQMTFEPNFNLFAAMQEITNAAVTAHATSEDGHRKRPTNSGIKSTRKGAAMPPVEMALSTSDIGKYRLEIKMLVVPELVGATEQAIVCAVGDLVHQLRRESASAPTIEPESSAGQANH